MFFILTVSLSTGREFIVAESKRTNKQGIKSLQAAFAHLPHSKVYIVNLDYLISHCVGKKEANTLHLKSFCSVIRGPPFEISPTSTTTVTNPSSPVVVVGGEIGKIFANWLQISRSEYDSAYHQCFNQQVSHNGQHLHPHRYNEHHARDQGHGHSHRGHEGEAHGPVKYDVLAVPDRDAANLVYINGHLIRRSSQEFPNSGVIFDSFVRKMNHSHRGHVIVQKEVNASELAKVDGAITCCSLLF